MVCKRYSKRSLHSNGTAPYIDSYAFSVVPINKCFLGYKLKNDANVRSIKSDPIAATFAGISVTAFAMVLLSKRSFVLNCGVIRFNPDMVAKYSIKLELLANNSGSVDGDMVSLEYKSSICNVTSTSMGRPSIERLSSFCDFVI